MEENKAGWRHSISDHTVFNNAAWNEIKSLFVFLSTKISLKCIFYQIDLYIVLALLFGIENRRSLLIVHKRICRKLSSSLISAAMFTRNCLLTDPVRNKTKRTAQTEPMVTFFRRFDFAQFQNFFLDWLSVRTTTYFRLGFRISPVATHWQISCPWKEQFLLSTPGLDSETLPLGLCVSSCDRSMLHTAWITYSL